MKHVETIKALIKTLIKSETFHALLIKSAPGWGKSSTIDKVLKEIGIQAVSAGTYATPLHIYNLMCKNESSLLILDDCAGLLNDPKGMAILKAATWQSSGNSGIQDSRRIAWGSASEKVGQPFVDFTGKIILLANSVPAGKDTEAFLSRCLNYQIPMNLELIKEMLASAAESKVHFPQSKIAKEVVKFLVAPSTQIDLMKVNLRTLKMGYDLALDHRDSWKELFLQLLPKVSHSGDSSSEIFTPGLTVKEQEAKYVALTGKSRRSFYNYKKKLGLSRAYGME